MLEYRATPITELNDPVIEAAGIRVFVKREDLNHTAISGNKWWKLKYNLAEAIETGCESVLTFGGAYSNHIFATAAAARAFGLKSIGFIRGEEIVPYNTTLAFVKNQGMRLHFVSREEYRKKNDEQFIRQLKDEFGDFYLIPEGGSNANAVRGVKEFAERILSENDFDSMILPVGTGGTLAGLICGLPSSKQILGVSVLRGGDFLVDDTQNLARSICEDFSKTNWTILTDYDFGGYAKSSPALEEFISDFFQKHNIPLEPVYSGKAMWALWNEISTGRFERGTKILFLHTGGLQNKLL